MIQGIINSFWHALNGIKTVFQEERNFKIEIVAGVLVLFTAFLFKFTYTELLFYVIAIILVLISEILNTAIEDLCDKVEPQHDKVIGKIKDIMAGFTLVSSIGAFAIGVIVFLNHLN
jgi:diacylglycerol kinase